MTVRCASIVSHVEFELLHQKDSHQRLAQYNAQHTTHSTVGTVRTCKSSNLILYCKECKTYRSTCEMLLTVHLVACVCNHQMGVLQYINLFSC